MNKLQAERVDVSRSIRSMSCNVPGHKRRLKAHCERVQCEYFDSGLHKAQMYLAQFIDEIDDYIS